MGKKVLVVPENSINFSIFDNGWAEVSKAGKGLLNQLLGIAYFIDRDKAEQDPTHKQLIPYCLVKNKKGETFVYQRTKKGQESRLHAKYSFGIGGHEDYSLQFDKMTRMDFHYGNLDRELTEEVGLTRDDYNDKFVGFLYDASNSVGAVHLGLVYHITPKDWDFDINSFKIEDTLGDCGFWSSSKINVNKDKFEGWSQVLINNKVL